MYVDQRSWDLRLVAWGWCEWPAPFPGPTTSSNPCTIGDSMPLSHGITRAAESLVPLAHPTTATDPLPSAHPRSTFQPLSIRSPQLQKASCFILLIQGSVAICLLARPSHRVECGENSYAICSSDLTFAECIMPFAHPVVWTAILICHSALYIVEGPVTRDHPVIFIAETTYQPLAHPIVWIAASL